MLRRFTAATAAATAGYFLLSADTKTRNEIWTRQKTKVQTFFQDHRQSNQLFCDSKSTVSESLKSVAQRVKQGIVSIQVELDLPRKWTWNPRNQSLSVLQSVGTGFFVQSDGWILTNAHVVQDVLHGGRMTITLSDGSEYDGELFAMDAWSDFALVRIRLPNLPQDHGLDEEWEDIKERFHVIPLSSEPASSLEQGDVLFTFGHPIGLRYSLTMGIVSHPNRENTELDMNGVLDARLKLVQMNFAGVDRGYSGGPVFNMQGECVCINVIKADSEGISFAIRLDTVLSLIQQLMRDGRVDRPWLGVKTVALNELVLRQLRHAVQNHQHQQAVVAATPSSSSHFPPLQQPGSLMGNLLKGRQREPQNPETEVKPNSTAIHEMDEQDRRMLQIVNASITTGLLVLEVCEDSPASVAELRMGDVITAVNGQPVDSAQSFLTLLTENIHKPMTIRVLRPIMEQGVNSSLVANTPSKGPTKKSHVLSIVEETLVLTPDQLDIFAQMDEVPESERRVAEQLTGQQREKYEFLSKS